MFYMHQSDTYKGCKILTQLKPYTSPSLAAAVLQ